MARPLVVRGPVLVWGIATFACWSGSQAPRDTPIENRQQAPLVQHEPRTTPYWCSITDGGYEYPQMPCAIGMLDGNEVLAKLAGSQRFRGIIKRRGDGFSFVGEFYCPWGDCTKMLRGQFQPIGGGALRGTFEEESLVVTLVPAPADSVWGGASYGGDGYGGVGYGGFGDRGRRRRH